MSQIDLGAALGITYQQVQKYELGKDRVAASTLQRIAAALNVHPGLLFIGDALVPVGKGSEVRSAMVVAADWQRISNPDTRKGLATLAREGA